MAVRRKVNKKEADKLRGMGILVNEDARTGKLYATFTAEGKVRKALKKELTKRKKKEKKEKEEKDILKRLTDTEDTLGKKADRE